MGGPSVIARADRLLIFQMALLAEIVLYREILRLFLKATGTWSDVGSNFMAFWLLAVVPGALLLGALGSWSHRWLSSNRPDQTRAWLAGVWILNVTLLVVSLIVYSLDLHE